MKSQSGNVSVINKNPQRRAVMRVGAVASMLMLSGFGSAAMAQDSAKPGRGLNVPCCQCIDGKETVIDLSTGGTAPWTSSSGAVTSATTAGPWASSSPAKWIYTGTTAAGFYKYQMEINTPKCIIPMTAKIEGKAWADDVMKMQFDGNPIGSSANPAVAANSLVGGTWPSVSYAAGSWGGFGQAANLNISQTINLSGSGNHILTATVDNAGGPTGFLFNGKLVIKCASGPLTQNGPRRD